MREGRREGRVWRVPGERDREQTGTEEEQSRVGTTEVQQRFSIFVWQERRKEKKENKVFVT